MIGDSYIPNAATEMDHLNNVLFQAANVKGWLSAGQRENAHTKSQCLLRDAELLVAAFEAKARKEAGQ